MQARGVGGGGRGRGRALLDGLTLLHEGGTLALLLLHMGGPGMVGKGLM